MYPEDEVHLAVSFQVSVDEGSRLGSTVEGVAEGTAEEAGGLHLPLR